MNTHSCIKCKATYTSSDEDPYYCDPCDKARVAIAQEIDKKLSVRGERKRGISLREEYMNAPKINGFQIFKL